MPDLRTILERESETVQAPDGFERLVRRRDQRRRNRRIGAAVVALVLAVAATGLVVRAFQEVSREVPAGVVAGCPAGATPDEPGPISQARPGMDRQTMERMAFDSESGAAVLFGVRYVHEDSWAADVWAYDVCTNHWKQMGAQTEHTGRGWGPGWTHAVYDADSDLTVVIGGDGAVFAYDLDADELIQKARAVPETPLRLVYDPATGLVIAYSLEDPSPMWTYDVESDTWAPLGDDTAPIHWSAHDHALLAYDASIDRVVAYLGGAEPGPEGGATYTFDPRTGVWLEIATDTPAINTGFIASGGEVAYDQAAQRSVVFSDGILIAFDASANRWVTLHGELPATSRLGNGPLFRLGHSMVYDAVNERLLVYGGDYRTEDGWVRADDVWAFDLPTNEWIQLLAPSEPYPEGVSVPDVG